MMVETILESSQDFGVSNGSLPQWKRELLQRRAARSRPSAAPAPPPPPPPPPPLEEDEELRYGPGIVKRLKSRYLSLALRDAPRRRPSVLRRAASLEHLLDERPPPAPRATRTPRPASLAAAPAPPPHPQPARRDAVKRARSVDALSRLDSREEAEPPRERAPRPPRRPRPLLRDAERPPPDLVRSALRKFESAPTRRPAPAARLSAVLRGLEAPRRSLTPETPRTPSPPPESPPPPVPREAPSPIPRENRPSIPAVPAPSPPPAAPVSEPLCPPASPAFDRTRRRVVDAPKVIAPETIERPDEIPAGPEETRRPESRDEVEGCAASRPTRRVSRAALEEIARAGSSVRYSFSSPRAADHLPPLAATNPVLMARAVPLRRVGVIRPMPHRDPKPESGTSPAAPERETSVSPGRSDVRSPPPSASVEPRVRAAESPGLVNGHSTPEPHALSRIGAAGIERAWSGSAVRRIEPVSERRAAWGGGGAAPRPRAPPPAATSVVFNFSDRKEVPDYIENDGIILRANRRNMIKAGEPGVVVLRPELLVEVGAEGEGEEWEGEAGPPSPCDVRFVNDNVLINGRSSMPARPNKDRIAKLKLQFDDSLTRTFEYPSETSLSEESPAHLPAHPPAHPSALQDNTHMASAALSQYTPKTCAPAFTLGLTSPTAHAAHAAHADTGVNGSGECEGAGGEGVEGRAGGEGGACGADLAKSWSEARAKHTDLLF